MTSYRITVRENQTAIGAEKSKTARQRYVKILPNLYPPCGAAPGSDVKPVRPGGLR